MFTVEMEFDETVVTVIDDSGQMEDIKIHLSDDVVYFRQYNQVTERDELIQITPDMWQEMLLALEKPSGSYVTR